MLKWLLNSPKRIFSSIEQAIYVLIFFALFGGAASLLLSSKKALNYSIQILKQPILLWQAIVFLLICCICLYIKLKKNQSWSLLKSKDYIFITEMGLLWKVDKITQELNPIPLCPKHKHEMTEIKDSYLCHSCHGASRKYIPKKDVDFVRVLVTSKIDAAIDGHLKE